MTTPLAAPVALHAAYSDGLSAQAIASRVDMLNANGHQWMPADMQTTLASSPTSDSGLLQAAHTIKHTLSSAWDGFTEAFDDPVLHKTPSTSLALARLVNSSLGPLPVEETDLTGIQADLQRLGFGKDLAPNGVWGADWNDAYNQYAHDVVSKQLAGDRAGSVTTGSAAHHWYDDFTPSHAFDAVVGFAKSLPGDVRDLAAHVLSGQNIFNPAINAAGGYRDPLSRRLSTDVGNIGRKHKMTEAEFEAHARTLASQLQDVGTVLTLVPVIGQGSRAYQVAAKTLAEGVTKDAAVRTSGTVAKSLFGGIGRDAEGNLPALAERAALRRGPLNSRVFTNLPLLKQAGPVVGRLADADGYYYRARTLLATPYRYPLVRIAGDIGQRGLMTGAALRAGAQLSDKIAGPNHLTSDIQDTQATDLIDRSIQRITGTPFEHSFTDAINALGFVLHGPLGSTANSTRVGDTVQAFTDATDEALGKVNLLGAYQRAKQAADGSRFLPSYEDMWKEFGSEEHFKRFLVMKAATIAAMGHAQKIVQEGTADTPGLQYGDSGYREALAAAHNAIWADPAQHLQAVRELIAHDGGNYLTNRLLTDMTRTDADVRDYTSDGAAWMRAGDLLTGSIRNGDARHMFGANGQTVIHDAQDDFDFGLGQGENPLRTTGMTRRKYNAEVSHLMGRVRNGIGAARTQAQRNLSDALADLSNKKTAIAGMSTSDDGYQEARVAVRKAQGAVQSAKLRQQKIEDALVSNLGYRIEDTLAKLRSPHGSDAEWAHVASDVKRLRVLVGPSLGQGEKFNLLDALEQDVDPDVLYTKINGAPRPSDAAIGSGAWMAENVPHASGVLSVARLKTKTMQEARNDLNALEARLQSATDQDEITRVVEEIKDYAQAHFGVDARPLSMFDDDPQRLMDILLGRVDDVRFRKTLHDLASDVMLTPDAPARLRQAVADMAAHGYKPVIGQHIGHIWDGSLPPLEDVGGVVTRRKRVIGALGLDTTQVSSQTVGQAARLRALNKMQQAINEDKRIVVPQRHTAESIWAVLDDHNIFQPKMKLPERVAFYATYPIHKRGIEQLAKDRGLESLGEAREAYEHELVRALQFRDAPRKEAMKALTTPATYENGAYWPGVDKRSAALIWRAGLEGYSARPNYLMGLSAIEDWGRAGFTILGKLAHTFPDSGAIQAFANLPNEIVQLRNRWRFSLSPFYDFRRVTKTNYKMLADGTTPVFNPLKHLVDNGTFDKAHALLMKLRGETSTAGYDDADRYLHQQSIFGVYNARHYEAYYAWEKHLEGWDDDKIRQGLLRVFEYGSTRKAGRSALERSVNTIFFPFSFEKTLIRNTGMYLLDHPQQALLITGAVDAYHRANQHEAITDWVNDHLPVLEDMNKLNAFAHGISPGQFGGINAPLAGMFSPQVWHSASYTKANLEHSVAIWHDFARLASDVHQQAIVAHNVEQNALSYAIHLGAPRGPLDPYKPMETEYAQRRDASVLRNKAIIAFSDALDYNAHQADDSTKIRFGDQAELPPAVQGQVVNRTTIGYLVQRWFPAYDPTFSQTYAIKEQDAAQEAIAKIRAKDPARAQQFEVFTKLADQVATYLRNGDYDTPTAAQVIMQFRTAAAGASETDPDFYAFYRAHYQYVFGPLEEVRAL